MAGVLGPADIAEFAFLHSDLVKTDPYRLIRTGPLDVHLAQLNKDLQGNRETLEVVIEEGFCRLVSASTRQADTVLVGGGISWKAAYRIQFDLDSQVDAETVVEIGSRRFGVDAVFEGGGLSLWREAHVEERSR